MRLSIIIPSFNQACFIGETLDSITCQGIPGVEILVVDGGSTDGTLELLKSRDSDIAWWCSEPDRGQTHAINKGLARMTGDAWLYLNSDDLLAPHAIGRVMNFFADHPECDWLCAHAETFDHNGITGEVAPGPADRPIDYLAPWSRRHHHVFPFSGCSFMRRSLSDRLGPMDESLHYSMDIDYYCRAVFDGGSEPLLLPDTLARWRWHPSAKTMERGLAYAFREDEITIAKRYLNRLPAGQQRELRRQLRREQRLIGPRKACHLVAQGDRSAALRLLSRDALRHPGNLISRPWLGALKRALVLHR